MPLLAVAYYRWQLRHVTLCLSHDGVAYVVMIDAHINVLLRAQFLHYFVSSIQGFSGDVFGLGFGICS